MKSGITRSIIFFIVVLLAACRSSIGEPYDANKLSQFVPLQTTMDQVIAAMGKPQDQVTDDDGSSRLIYFYFVPRTDAASHGTSIYFDADGRFLRAESSRLPSGTACGNSPDATTPPSPCPEWVRVVARVISAG